MAQLLTDRERVRRNIKEIIITKEEPLDEVK